METIYVRTPACLLLYTDIKKICLTLSILLRRANLSRDRIAPKSRPQP